MRAHTFADYTDRCRWHQTSPESHFRKSRVCSRATPEGRLTLSGMRLIETTLSGEQRERTAASEAERTRLLAEHFGVVSLGTH
ncbi:MAG: arylamine N-acetyltransferase [bacterium]|nr:arylamine N-acetyltransferase [bacterium]